MENTVLHLKCKSGARGSLLTYEAWHYIKVAQISPGYDAYLNLDNEMISRVPIVDAKFNLKLTQESLDKVYLSYQCDTFKVDNALVYYRHGCIYLHETEENNAGWSNSVLWHPQAFYQPWPCGQAGCRCRKKDANISLWWWEKGWDQDKYVTFDKKQHAIMESLTDYGYSGMDNGTKVHHLLQGIKSTELEAAFNVVWAQTEKYGTDFDVSVSYLDQMVTKKGASIQSDILQSQWRIKMWSSSGK